MNLKATSTSAVGVIPWLPIPKNFLAGDLEPGIYFLRNRILPDQCAGLSIGKGEGWRRINWQSTRYMCSISENAEQDVCQSSTEEVEYSLLVAVIRDKLKGLQLHDEMDHENTVLELQNINELLLMGFDYYAHDSSCTTLAGEENLVNFFHMNPCLCPVTNCNASPTVSQTDSPEIEDMKARINQCFVSVRRLEDEFPAEFVDKLWKSYNESIRVKPDDEGDNEDSNLDFSSAPATKRRSGRGRKLQLKSSSKKKSAKHKYHSMSSESSSDNDTTDHDDGEEGDADYTPSGQRKRGTRYCLRRRT